MAQAASQMIMLYFRLTDVPCNTKGGQDYLQLSVIDFQYKSHNSLFQRSVVEN